MAAQQIAASQGYAFGDIAADPQRPVTTPFTSQASYYKMQATCSTSPTGYISWVNTTGDTQGMPSCPGVVGDAVEIARWTQ